MKRVRNLVIAPVVLALVAVLAFVATATAARTDNTLVKFQGGIGVDGVSNGVGTEATAATVTRNIVRGVQPAAQLWKIAAFEAEVKADGHITAEGRGLVFAGGDTVGTAIVPGGIANLNVFATLICENVAPFVDRNTKAVPLAANGNFTIDDVLSARPPASCTTPVLLIRNAGNLSWFSAGIQKLAGGPGSEG
jgi:hypothetical protein